MGRKCKFNSAIKVAIAQEYLNCNGSALDIAQRYGCGETSVRKWVAQYQEYGEDALQSSSKNQRYTGEFRRLIVEEYQHTDISLLELSVKYHLSSPGLIQLWIKKYNGQEKLKSYVSTTGASTMTIGRKTTYEERMEIVEDCLRNGRNYCATAEKFNVSYQQIYGWVKKYESRGVAGLKDHRGRGKPLEDMNDTERLEAENKLLRAQIDQLKLELKVKKKLQEIRMQIELGCRRQK